MRKIQSIRRNGLWIAIIVLGGFTLLSTSAIHRNLCYLEMAKGDWDCARSQTLAVRSDSNSADVQMAFRLFIHDSNWARAGVLAPTALTGANDGWILLWVIRSIEYQLERGDLSAAEPTLDFVRNTGSANPKVWYALGRAYELGGLAKQRSRNADTKLFDGTLAYENNTWFDRAALAYRTGLNVDSNGVWTEGTYSLAMLYYRQAHWNQVIDELEPMLTNATDEQIKQPIYGQFGPDWQKVYILLAHSYQQIGRWDDAKRIWQRMFAIQGIRQDWTLNIGLRSLAAIEARQARFESALEYLAQALELSFTFPDDYRAAYEQSTWVSVFKTMRQAHQQLAWASVQRAAMSLTTRFPNHASTWYIFGMFKDAECNQKEAAAAYVEAKRLLPKTADEFPVFSATSNWICMNSDLEKP